MWKEKDPHQFAGFHPKRLGPKALEQLTAKRMKVLE
jgi:hypothetical protein